MLLLLNDFFFLHKLQLELQDPCTHPHFVPLRWSFESEGKMALAWRNF